MCLLNTTKLQTVIKSNSSNLYILASVLKSCFIWSFSEMLGFMNALIGNFHSWLNYFWCLSVDTWVHCNDTKMNMVTIDDVYKAQAYILVYTKNFSMENHSSENSSCIPKYSDLKRKLNGDMQSNYMWKKRRTTVWWTISRQRSLRIRRIVFILSVGPFALFVGFHVGAELCTFFEVSGDLVYTVI